MKVCNCTYTQSSNLYADVHRQDAEIKTIEPNLGYIRDHLRLLIRPDLDDEKKKEFEQTLLFLKINIFF